MLQHLSIINYAIIERLELEFENDFAVITGETGAGKSILLGALSLILGQRTDVSVLNDKSKKCIVEGAFVIKSDRLKKVFSQNDLDFETISIIRREINAKGKSRAFINDTPVNLSILKEVSSQLIDIHSQHQTLSINDSLFQVNVIDSFAKIEKEKTIYGQQFSAFKLKEHELSDLIDQSQNSKNDIDFIQFQLDEIRNLNLKDSEQKRLEEQLELANNAEDIKRVILESSELLSNSENSVVSIINQLSNSFSKISHCSEEYKVLHNRLISLNIELTDLASEIELLNSGNDENAVDIDFITMRLSSIYTLNQKHRKNDSDELLILSDQFEEELNTFNSSDEKIEALKDELSILGSELLNMAQLISKKRTKVFSKFEKIITNSLTELGIPQASFVIQHSQSEKVKANGIDEIEFLFSANKGFEAKPLGKIASGGELSRLMLSIKSMLTKSANISTIIFDEIDTGVSGDIADKMGMIMKQMSNEIQVISITHLPQVAAKGNRHFKIYKKVVNGKTFTLLDQLSDEDRVEELAKMLSGKKLTDIARENAKSLLLS